MKLPRLRCLVKWPFKGIYLEGESQFTGVLHHELLLQRLNWSTLRGRLQEAYTPFLDWLRKVHLQAVCYKNFSQTCAWPYGLLQLLGLFQPMLLHYAIIELPAQSEDVFVLTGNKKKRPGNILKEGKRTFLVVASDLVPTLEAKWGVKLVVKKKLLGSELENCRFYFFPSMRRNSESGNFLIK